ncbi:MAG: hypothetical protein IKE92_08060 [Clostridiales bacterium]|nr:hypothetical protein [Clostridiales bacterium]
MAKPVPIRRKENYGLKIFTDRENICSEDGVFWKELDNLNNNKDDLSIINIHGIAGIGKTTVVSYLIDLLEKKQYGDYFFYKMDKYGYGIKLEKERFLIEFAYHLIIHHTEIDFSTFLYAYSKIKNRSDPEQAVIDGLRSLDDKYKTAIDIGAEIVLNPVPYGGLIKKGIDVAIDKFRKNPKKEDRKKIDSDSTENIKNNLLYYFSKDVLPFFQTLQHPYVVFIDDFERFVLPGGDVHDETDKLWFRDLTTGFPNILWVISGRDNIEWNYYYEKDTINQKITLNGFEDSKYVKEYFDKYSECSGSPKISEEAAKHIWELTKGVPFYLKLCLDRYDACGDKANISMEEFGKGTEELWKRFYNNYTDDQKDLMAFLCTLPDNWTYEESQAIYKNVNEDYRGTLKDFRKLFKEMERTSAFTLEDGVIRIHDVVRTSVLQNATELDDRELILNYLEAQKKWASRFGKQGFWEKECSYRKNICNRLETWGQTRGEYEKPLADALTEWGDGLMYRETSDNFADENLAQKAIVIYKKALQYYQDMSDWYVVDAYIGLIDAHLHACDNEMALTRGYECFNLIKQYHSDDWKRSVVEMYRVWNHIGEPDDEIVDYIRSILDAHQNEKNKEILKIKSSVRKWEDNNVDDLDYYRQMEEEAERLNLEMDTIVGELEKEYKDFITDFETRTDPYTEEECSKILTLIHNRTALFFTDGSVTDLSEKLYEIRKRQNGGKDNADTINALKAEIDYLEQTDDRKGLEKIWKKICDIQLADDYESERSGLGSDLLSLAAARKENQDLEGTINCYELILENFDEYENDIGKTREELMVLIQELKELNLK